MNFVIAAHVIEFVKDNVKFFYQSLNLLLHGFPDRTCFFQALIDSFFECGQTLIDVELVVRASTGA